MTTMNNNFTEFSPSIKIFCPEHNFVSSNYGEKIEKENGVDVNYLADCGCIIEYEYNK